MEINKKIKLFDFKLTKALWKGLFGVYKSVFKWVWIEFVEHREYSFWDSIKNIDWKTSARTDTIYTKIFEEERDINVLFLIDVNKTMDFWTEDKTKKDILEEIFYSLAFSAVQNNDNVWAYIYLDNFKKFINYKKWVWNIFRILEEIYEIEDFNENKQIKKDNEKSILWRTEKVLYEINRKNIRNNLIFILTDDTNFTNENILKLVSTWNQVILINIFDYFENNLMDFNSNISLKSGSNFMNIDLNNKEKVEKYKKIRKEKLNILKNKLLKDKIWYLIIDTKTDIYKEIFWYFSKIKN